MVFCRHILMIPVLQAVFILPFAAQTKEDSLAGVLAKAKTDKEKCELYLKLSAEVQKSNPARSKQYADEAVKLASSMGDKKSMANSYHTLGSALQALGKYDEAIKTDSICLVMRQEIKDTAGIAKILNNIGLTYSDRGETRKALGYFTQSVEYRKLAKDEKGLARSYTNIGLCYSDLGEYDKALDYYMRALKMSEDNNDKDGQASALNNIAIVHYSQGLRDKALEYYFKALQLKEELGVKKSIASTTGNIGTIYQELKNYDKALEYQLRTLKIREEINDKKGLGTTYNNIASIFKDLKQYEKALSYCNKSYAFRKEIGDKNGMAHSLANLAEIEKLLGKKQDAVKHIEESTSLLEEIDAKGALISNYQLMADLYANTGNMNKAYDALQKCLVMKDSVFQSDNLRRIADMQAKYESDKQQKAIELLTKENEIRELQGKRNRLIFIVAGVAVLVLLFFMYSRYQLKQKANKQLQSAYKEIEAKNKDITDSIRYAKRIQEAILPPSRVVKKYVVDSFIFFKPKDIVSGDFYWMEHRDNKTLFAAVDCTGHGVPGAFMSIVGHNLLNQIVNERGKTEPSVILNELNISLSETLKNEEDASVKDGMDIALCCIDFDSNVLQYAGAYNPLYILRRGNEPISFLSEPFNLKMTSLTRDGITLTEIKADKFPIGADGGGGAGKYTNRKIKLFKGDVFYIFSDGYADQFGGPKGKKFKYNQFKNQLITIHDRSMEEQKQIMENTISGWMSGREQVDDILVIGVKI